MDQERRRVAITLRFRPATFAEGKALAQKQNRTFNGFVETLIQEALAEDARREARQRRGHHPGHPGPSPPRQGAG